MSQHLSTPGWRNENGPEDRVGYANGVRTTLNVLSVKNGKGECACSYAKLER